MRTLTRLFCGLIVLATTALSTSSAVKAETLCISGGGTATFDDFEGGTIFSVQAQIHEDGSVSGHFFCAIPGIVTINGDDLVAATLNEDGSVTLCGFAHGYDAFFGGAYFDMPFVVQLYAGPAGTARFIYDDPVVGPSGGVDISEGDRETVASGHIMFRVK